MTAPIAKSKSALREQIRARMKLIPATAREIASQQLRQRLKDSEVWRNAQAILFFAPMADEPDLWPLLKDAADAGKQVALPRFDGEKEIYVACEIQNPAEDL